MGVTNPAYPAVHTRTAADLERFEKLAGRFKDAFSNNISVYVIEPRPATAAPYIMSQGANRDRRIMLGEGAWSDSTAPTTLVQFSATWEEFFNPYGTSLTDNRLDCNHVRYCGHDRIQDICGLPVRQLENHFYQGSIDISVDRETGALAWVQSSVVPQVPLPTANVTEAEILAVLPGQEVDRSCKGTEILRERNCIVTMQDPYILIHERGSIGNTDTIEYRIVVDAEITSNCEGEPVIVTIDAVEKVMLSSRAKRGCVN